MLAPNPHGLKDATTQETTGRAQVDSASPRCASQEPERSGAFALSTPSADTDGRWSRRVGPPPSHARG
ncbi:MAG: hypothetical protein QM778_18970 [Myxococcales bacterium]